MDFEQTAALMPSFLLPLLSEQYDEQRVHDIVEGYGAARLTTLRANTLLSDAEEVASALTQAGIEYEKVTWYDDAFIILNAREKALWQLPVYQEGKIYLQSLSSMLPALAMQVKPQIDILDMCAAPGGKTTQMAALGKKGCHITACELNAPRAERLRFNLDKQGAGSVVVMKEDSRKLSDYFSFDQILLDAPCSGSGTLHANDVKLHRRFTEALVAKSVKSQHALLEKALKLLKPGGTCVYSTCSILEKENESVVKHCLDKANKRGSYKLVNLNEQFSPESNNIPTLPTSLPEAICVAPTNRFEGFFMAKIKKES